MTTTPMRPATAWPGLDSIPSDLRTEVSARVARRLFRAAVSRLPVTVREGSDSTRTWGTGGPEMRIQRPTEFFTRLGRDGLIGFGEAYMTGAWGTDDLGGFLTVLAGEAADADPGSAADAAGGVRATSAPRAQEHRRSTPGRTSRTTTTCPTTCSSSSSTRR